MTEWQLRSEYRCTMGDYSSRSILLLSWTPTLLKVGRSPTKKWWKVHYIILIDFGNELIAWQLKIGENTTTNEIYQFQSYYINSWKKKKFQSIPRIRIKFLRRRGLAANVTKSKIQLIKVVISKYERSG